jgi:hypothetical protein
MAMIRYVACQIKRRSTRHHVPLCQVLRDYRIVADSHPLMPQPARMPEACKAKIPLIEQLKVS